MDATYGSARAVDGPARTAGEPAHHKPLYQHMYVQVLFAIVVGTVLGFLAPQIAVQMKPLGDAFIRLIRMLIAPIIFCTVVVGIARMGDMKEVGRIGVKAILYFEAVTTLALLVGLLVVNVLKPGAGMNVDPNALDTKSIQSYTQSAEHLNGIDFFMNMIPNTVFDAFTKGDVIQVLVFSILIGAALAHLGTKGQLFVDAVDQAGHALFGVVRLIMYLAPLGAFGAIAFTIGTYGVGTLVSLGKLVAGVYLTSFLFVVVVLGIITRLAGFSLWRFLRYIKEEIFLIFGTTSAEIAMPRIMAKLENLGCARPVVGLVVPTGYSFNLDGSAIYLTMGAVFIAQATNTPLDIPHQLGLLGVLMITSKGAASVTGAGFVTLAATLSSTGVLPVAGLALLLGVDRFMSESRAVSNLIGNAVAGVVVAKWERAIDADRMQSVLSNESDAEADAPEEVLDSETLRPIPIASTTRANRHPLAAESRGALVHGASTLDRP